jgi:hypothetical protein
MYISSLKTEAAYCSEMSIYVVNAEIHIINKGRRENHKTKVTDYSENHIGVWYICLPMCFKELDADAFTGTAIKADTFL